MKKAKNLLVTLAIVAMLISMIPLQAFANQTFPTRLSGTTQYDTAAQIAEQGWAHGSHDAVLAAGMTGHTLVDALAAGTLAAVWNIPIILTEGTTLTPAAAAELTKLRVTRVYVTSGKAVIQQPVMDALKALGMEVIPLGGFDAAETSVNIAKEIAKRVPITSIALAGGSGADALSVASIAGVKKMPILYTDDATNLPVSVQGYIDGLSDISVSYVIGGTTIVSEAEKDQLPGTPIRYSGSTAYDTNQAVIQGFNKDFTFSNVFVANGATLVDALAGAPLAAVKNAAIVLTDGKSITGANPINSKLSSSSVVTALGGAAVVPQKVLATLGYGVVPPLGTEGPNPKPASSSSPLILYPKDNEVIYSINRILITWTEVPNAESYVVTVSNGSDLIMNETVTKPSYAIPEESSLDYNVTIRVAANVQGTEYWSQSIQIYVNDFNPSYSNFSFVIDTPKNIDPGKDLVINWGCFKHTDGYYDPTAPKFSPKGIIDHLRLGIGDYNADRTSTAPAIVDVWLDASATTYTVPASLLTAGHRYSIGLTGTSTTDEQDPNIFEIWPSNTECWVNLQDMNPELEGSPLGPVINYPSNQYIDQIGRTYVSWNSIPGATTYACEIDDLTDKRIIEKLFTQENNMIISSDFIKERYHLYRLRIAAIVNGQENWGPSKTFEYLSLGSYIPRIILPPTDHYTYPQQDLLISWADYYPNQRNDYLNGPPIYRLVLKDNASEKVVLSTVVADATSYTIDKSLLLQGHDYYVSIVIASGNDTSDPNYYDTSTYTTGPEFWISN